MGNIVYGLRRMMGLTTPEEDEYQRQLEEREASASQSGPVQVQPGTALRQSQDTMDFATQELQRQSRPQAVQQAPVMAPAAPAQDFSKPEYGASTGDAMRALEGYGNGLRDIRSQPPKPASEEERRRRAAPGMMGVRG